MTDKGKRIPVNQCQKCGQCYAIPTYLCLKCHSTEMAEETLSGKGKLSSYTIIRVPPLGFEDQAPYTVAIIELDEGLKVTARLENDPVSNDLELLDPCQFIKHKDSVYWFQLEDKKTGVTR